MRRCIVFAVCASLAASPLLAGGDSRSGSSFASMIIRKYDTNKDGKLNADEYPERYRKYFGKSDSNNDGYVDSSELSTQLEEIRSQWREQMEKKAREYRAAKTRQLVQRAFEADTNGDERLNADEASGVIKKPFGDIDSNNDGYLARNEIEAAYGVKAETAKTIVETAAAAGAFKTLIKAAIAAGLDEALQGDGPFTVFAPTDEAFAKIPPQTLAALLKDKQKLAAILKYHVVAGKVLAKDVIKLSRAKTLQGSSVQVSEKEGVVRVDNAKVVKTDILCSNGVIHVIDSVLLPKSSSKIESKAKPESYLTSIVETASSAGSFDTLVAAVKAAGLVDALSGGDGLTVFAPTDEAFSKVPKPLLKRLLADKEKLKAILTYHVVPGRVFAKDVVKLKSAKTLQGESVKIFVTDKGVKIDNANVLKTDIKCSNGVIHVIDSLILPGLMEMVSNASRELIDISGGDIQQQWVTVNDGVMGGVSEGNVRQTKDGAIEFFGELSLRNNGGFASLRSKPQELKLEDGDTLVVRLRGDGREYYLNLYEPGFRTAFSFRAPIQTEKGKWLDVRLKLSDFYATSFGRTVRNAELEPVKVNAVGFLLSDKKAGPFRLEVASVKVEK